MKSLFKYLTESKSTVDTFKKKYSRLYNKISHSFTPKHDTLVISMCGETKYEGRDRIYAREMYKGPANQTLLKVLPDLPVDWLILSGGFGMMNQTSKIHTYTDVIMELTDTELKDLKDFVKYTDDIERHIKKGNYKEIYVTLSHIWITLIDWNRIVEAAGEKCQIVVFVNDKDYEDMPSSIINIPINTDMTAKFHAGMIMLKEKIVTDFLTYKQEHKSATIKRFISSRT